MSNMKDEKERRKIIIQILIIGLFILGLVVVLWLKGAYKENNQNNAGKERDTSASEQKYKKQLSEIIRNRKGDLSLVINYTDNIEPKTIDEETSYTEGDIYQIDVRYSFLEASENGILNEEKNYSLIYNKTKQHLTENDYEFTKSTIDNERGLYEFDDKNYTITADMDWIVSDVSTVSEDLIDKDKVIEICQNAMKSCMQEIEEGNSDVTALVEDMYKFEIDGEEYEVYVTSTSADFVEKNADTDNDYSEKNYMLRIDCCIK